MTDLPLNSSVGIWHPASQRSRNGAAATSSVYVNIDGAKRTGRIDGSGLSRIDMQQRVTREVLEELVRLLGET